MIQTEHLYALALMQIEGIGNVLARKIIQHTGSAEKVFSTSSSKLLKIAYIGEVLTQSITQQQKQALQKAEAELRRLAQMPNVHIHYYFDKNYPKRLKEIPDAPLLFFSQGNVEWNTKHCLAVVGTRNATDYGKSLTETLLQDLKSYNPLIISGLAYGIDVAAHRASLKYDLPTVAVMATGLGKIYPQIHQKIAMQIVEQGGSLITENLLDTAAEALRFPARNRIIAGLVDAVVVVEAKAKGGALITAELANSYNREVLAFPGSILSKSSEGCNHLIRDNKAQLITNAQDLIYALGWDLQKTHKQQVTQAAFDFSELDLTTEEMQIMELLQRNKLTERETHIDELSLQLMLPQSTINASLLNLEILGIIKALPGKYFRIN